MDREEEEEEDVDTNTAEERGDCPE